MITLENFAEVATRFRGAYLAVGNFDGVHRGHLHLLRQLRAKAEAAGTDAIALTFDPHPVALLRPEQAPIPLVWIERKVALLKEAGAHEVGVFKTGPWLLGLTAREFFDCVIVGQFGARGMVEGPNFAFGRDRGGDAALLASWCESAGLDFSMAGSTKVDNQLVSSSRIRRCLQEGRADEAAHLLGRPHRIRGLVTHGAGRGAGLGFPTANLDEVDTLIPADGVYAALAHLEGQPRTWPVACHIGPNVTFGEQIRKVEAHIIDFEGDLYGQTVELDILQQLRSTRPFANLEELLAQIRADVEQTRRICGEPE
ncbi:riboflavin kinase / FMN adenylyltransferase [Singulisphaera sp. GP187]|uniref:riboflavin biosynthesis protein RibF n=1 Tax=Singulisphaera sp. GP187 TaxID=1882752 RepID=UPI00092ADE67|nr:riboflavin biosynthesis protein RibF [Singulisphaera sp. GP187]SIO66612.1 riboflavin kinase / FMN adenylyltransferase [Singulisphaera sp. GP187]